MSKAIALIPELLRAEHPSTLENLLDTLIILKELGLVDIISMLLNYFYEMAGIILSEDHPWFQISRLMTLLTPDHTATALFRSWRCASDAFRRSLGPFSPRSVHCEAVFLYKAYTEDPLDAERHLRKLLVDCEKAVGSNNRSSLNILYWLGWELLYQKQFVETEAVGQDLLARAQYIKSDKRKIDGLDLCAHAQYYLNKLDLAERNMRDAMRLIADLWGKDSPDYLRNVIELERWLRGWGREGEADKLAQEIAELIGPDDLDA